MPGARTALFARNQPGGVVTIADVSDQPGDVWFVSSVTGTNSPGYGVNPDAPFASIDYAVSRVTSNKGDVIYVLPGHTEAISAAGSSLGNGGIFIGSTLSNGVSIIGVGQGRNRPVITWGTAIGASCDITAANVTLKNLVFNLAGFDAITAGFNVTGADVAFENCEFIISDGTNGVVLGILTAATAARLRVENCRFTGPAVNAGTTCTACIKHEVGVDYVIRNNYFTGKMTQAILNATALLRGLIDSNRFVIATGTLAITMHASSTPFIVNNRINVPSGTTPITAAAGFVAGNVYSAAAGVTAGTAVTI